RRHPRGGDEREGRPRASARREGDGRDRDAHARADERRACPAGWDGGDHRRGDDGAARLRDRRPGGARDPADAHRHADPLRAGRGRRADRGRARRVRCRRSRDAVRDDPRRRAVTPPIRYARSGDVHIAYQVIGDAPLDLVFVVGALTNLEVLWENADYRRFCERLASFARLILFDKRGMGLSDRVRVGTLEERMDDVRAIMDAVGSESAALMGVSEGGPLSMLFAATYPERTRALVLCGAEVKEETTDDWPWGEGTRDEFEEWTQIDRVVERWGKGLGAAVFAPSRKDDEQLRKLWGRLQVQSASPHDAVAF